MSNGDEHDIFRRAPIRFLGYANEVGEAFRSIIGTKWVNVSYGIATAYVLADTAHKSAKTFQAKKSDPHRIKKTIFITTDTLLWQMFASVIIPGYAINRVCAATNYFLHNKVMKQTTRKWIVTGIGLAIIPFIIRPIDHLVDDLLDISFRKLEP